MMISSSLLDQGRSGKATGNTFNRSLKYVFFKKIHLSFISK